MKLLNIIQTTLKAPKKQWNAFGKYNYRSTEDILEALKPMIQNAEGATLTFTENIEEAGGRIYIKSTVKLSYNGEFVEATGIAREAVTQKGMNDAQITGSTTSYARKYALGGLFALDDTKDADSTPESEVKKTEEELITPIQLTNIEKAEELLSAEDVYNGVRWVSANRANSVHDLSKAEAAKLIGVLAKKIEKKKGEA